MVNFLYGKSKSSVQLTLITLLTVYFNLDEDVGSQERNGTCLKAQNIIHEPLVHILLNSAHSRHTKIRNAIIPETKLMTEHAAVVLELRNVRICTSYDNIWIIDSLELHKKHDRRLTTTRNPLVMTLSDMDWSPTTLDVVVWARGSSLQFPTVKNVYSGQCNVKTSIISSDWISYSQMTVDIALLSQMAEQGSGKGVVNWYMHHGKMV